MMASKLVLRIFTEFELDGYKWLRIILSFVVLICLGMKFLFLFVAIFIFLWGLANCDAVFGFYNI